MVWYAVFESVTGAILSVSTYVDPLQLPEGAAFIPLDHRPDPEAEQWDPVAHAFVPRAKSKAELETQAIGPAYERWRMWSDTLAEATARGLSPAILTALQNKVDAIWTAYTAAINDWRNAQR